MVSETKQVDRTTNIRHNDPGSRLSQHRGDLVKGMHVIGEAVRQDNRPTVAWSVIHVGDPQNVGLDVSHRLLMHEMPSDFRTDLPNAGHVFPFRFLEGKGAQNISTRIFRSFQFPMRCSTSSPSFRGEPNVGRSHFLAMTLDSGPIWTRNVMRTIRSSTVTRREALRRHMSLVAFSLPYSLSWA